MPSSKPLIRSMDWKIAKEQMPDSISKHLPDGDPASNHEEIKQSIDRMIAVGPKGTEVIKRYVDGQISESEMEKQLDEVAESIDSEGLEDFRQNLRIIRQETNNQVWKEMIPLFFKGVNMRKIREAASELEEIHQKSIESENKEEFKKELLEEKN